MNRKVYEQLRGEFIQYWNSNKSQSELMKQVRKAFTASSSYFTRQGEEYPYPRLFLKWIESAQPYEFIGYLNSHEIILLFEEEE